MGNDYTFKVWLSTTFPWVSLLSLQDGWHWLESFPNFTRQLCGQFSPEEGIQQKQHTYVELAYSTELQHRTAFQHFPVYVSITITDKNISSSTLVTFLWILLLVLKVFWNQKSKKELSSLVPLGSDYFCSSIFKKCQDSYSLLHLHYLEFIITRWGPLLAALHLDSVTEYFLDMMSDVCSGKDWKNEFLPGNYTLNRTIWNSWCSRRSNLMNDCKSVINILQHMFMLADLYTQDTEDRTMNFCSLWNIKWVLCWEMGGFFFCLSAWCCVVILLFLLLLLSCFMCDLVCRLEVNMIFLYKK